MDQALRWIEGRFASATVEPDPFPHLILNGVLPSQLYEEIERDIPHSFDWRLAAITRRIGSGSLSTLARDIRSSNLPPMFIDVGNVRRSPFVLWRHSWKWRRKYLSLIRGISALVSRAFAEASASYMQQMIEMGLYDSTQTQRPSFQEFCLRPQGWAIEPHIHDLRQAVQWMLYFPLPGSTEDQGTAFYRVKSPKTLAPADLSGTMWFDASEAEHCFTAPYRPNTLVAFLNTPSSVHGSIEIPGMVARRYFFVGTLWNSALAPVAVAVPQSILSAVSVPVAVAAPTEPLYPPK